MYRSCSRIAMSPSLKLSACIVLNSFAPRFYHFHDFLPITFRITSSVAWLSKEIIPTMIESIDYRSLKVSKYPSSSLRPCPRELSQPRPPATLAPPPLSVPRKQKCTPASRAVHLVQRPQAGPRVHPSRPFLCTHSQGSDATTAAWPEGSAPATTKTRPPG